MRKGKTFAAAILAMALLLSGCGASGQATESDVKTETETESQVAEGDEKTEKEKKTSGTPSGKASGEMKRTESGRRTLWSSCAAAKAPASMISVPARTAAAVMCAAGGQ